MRLALLSIVRLVIISIHRGQRVSAYFHACLDAPSEAQTQQVSQKYLVVLSVPDTSNRFFTQLVDCLGPEEFTSPVCMLLIEKSASKVIHGRGRDTNADLALALSIAKQAKSQDHLTVR